MKNKNLFTIVSLIFGVCVLGILVWAAEEPKCQIPNSSTKACYDPDIRIFDCADQDHGYCVSNIYFVYQVSQFRDGTVKADKGATKTEAQPCWRRYGCFWNQRISMCENASDYGAWHPKENIVENPDVTCPDE
jgi:hypothetical protein